MKRDSTSLVSAIIFLLNPLIIFSLLYSPKNYGFVSVGYYLVQLLYLMSYYYLEKDWKKFVAFTVALTLTSPLSYFLYKIEGKELHRESQKANLKLSRG
ncbi:hypothetical protein SUSAZ_09895 [Sulfolobus acidocaldarius SUSAZ]|nr:hypothetical protein SUSAZ_09895 [Sulfolobus acidocaldarius SUSAZ]